ncbi:hypothetical protein Trydic_g2467 [Trypoxylus dichotomus]
MFSNFWTVVYMPRNDMEMSNCAEKFYGISRFPRVIGAIDCTLIKIQSPGGNDAEIFGSKCSNILDPSLELS